MQAKVTMIPATRNSVTGIPHRSKKKRRVAAYARVSTDTDEQLTSYEAQVDYYTRYIKNNPEWEYVETYADEGISGVMTKHRDGFNRMINDALDGKIDLIITKSVSRFARNTVDSLTTIRQLKEKGVEVYFEKENIYTLDSKGELLLTLMSSLAQEESRSLSQNVTWGQRKRFSDGKVSMSYKQFLGYKKGENGEPVIVPEEAAIIRRIYREFIHGSSIHQIAKGLMADNIPSPAGKERWCISTVKSILANEKYKGDALLQKTFTQDFLTKKMKKNEGEIPQYYVTGSHPGIIKPEEWDLVQIEFNKRFSKKGYNSNLFAGRVICGDCGSAFGSKVWHSTDKYRKTIWQCNHKFDGEKKCTTPHLNENRLIEMFNDAYSMFYDDKDQVIKDLRMLLDACFHTDELQQKITELEQDLELTSVALNKCISENASASISEVEYKERYSSLLDRHEKLQESYSVCVSKINKAEEESTSIKNLIQIIEDTDTLPIEFDPYLWRTVVEKAVVRSDGIVEFHLIDNKKYEFPIK